MFFFVNLTGPNVHENRNPILGGAIGFASVIITLIREIQEFDKTIRTKAG